MGGTKIIIADAQTTFASGLQLLFERTGKIEVVSIVSEVSQLLDYASSKQYQVLLLDGNMRGADLSEIIKNLIRIRPHSRVVLMHQEHEPIAVSKEFESSVLGQVSKKAAISDFIEIIEQAVRH
jgi:DNA-binding NarL/FixJ family response regulator